MFNFLKFALMGETKIEVALSSTCVFMAFRMKKAVSGPIKFGEGCVANYPLPFEARCIKKPPNEQEHGDSLTAVAFSGTTLYSFETAESVKKKTVTGFTCRKFPDDSEGHIKNSLASCLARLNNGPAAATLERAMSKIASYATWHALLHGTPFIRAINCIFKYALRAGLITFTCASTK
ncbi:hypothetical protein V5799_032168 [Amblyomma americanum]|uniref:Uncharacterized protein n=1 Tax=Amblyomma americanum TaxID=6943 RepID=A0AAQ4DRY4_AMBAM